MKQLTITIDDFLYDFYRKIGDNVGKTPEKTIEDALFRLAGELSMEAISKKERGKSNAAQKRTARGRFFSHILHVASSIHGRGGPWGCGWSEISRCQCPGGPDRRSRRSGASFAGCGQCC